MGLSFRRFADAALDANLAGWWRQAGSVTEARYLVLHLAQYGRYPAGLDIARATARDTSSDERSHPAIFEYGGLTDLRQTKLVNGSDRAFQAESCQAATGPFPAIGNCLAGNDRKWAVNGMTASDIDAAQAAAAYICRPLPTPEPLSLVCPHRVATFEFAVLAPQRPPASGFVRAAPIVDKHRQLDPRDVLVGELPTLILRQRCEAGRQMGCADGAVGFVDMLPARSRGAERLVANVLVMQVRRFRTRRRTVPEPSQFPAPHRCTL